jgi:tRNA U34 5-methylaminomethyl-2-thiouridine-forming methyltransferase MnmC
MSEKTQAPEGNYQYELVYTEDGSPSIRMGSPSQVPEVMHHSGGALTESLFVYSAAVARVLELGWRPAIVSVGLGLGYNEMITVANCLRADLADGRSRLSALDLASFEVDPLLRHQFASWLTGTVRLEGPIDFWSIYDDVLARIAKNFELNSSHLKTAISKCFENGNLKLYEALETRPKLNNSYTCILFDAFSKKSTPDLWQEPFLVEFLASACAPQCVLATYAATGNLNRALRANGFTLIPRTGFQGKRESTWAERGL